MLMVQTGKMLVCMIVIILEKFNKSKNSNHVVIGVTGHLYSKNINRGVYVTKDGGKIGIGHYM